MYVAGVDHPNREPSRRFLEQVKLGKIDACTSTEVLQEILYRYSSLRKLALASQVYDLFVEICAEVFDVTLADTDTAKDLLCADLGISARDSVHAAVMLNHSVKWIATFDSDFDRIAGIQRRKMS